jgi:inosine-uridine nucleoside N-ribohydrolase
VHGNVPLRHGFANAAQLLTVLGREDVSLAAGAEVPISPVERHAHWLAERDGWERLLPAFEGPFPEPRPVDVIRAFAGTLIAIGPLTNVAAALRADPSLPERWDRVVIMGGAFQVAGNVTPTAEFNVFADPEAARVVLDAGVRPVFVGLDVCHQTALPGRPRGGLGAFFERAAGAWLASDGPYLYDSLAVAAAIDPELLTLEPAHVRVEPDGGTVTSPGPPNALVARAVDAGAFHALLGERVL